MASASIAFQNIRAVIRASAICAILVSCVSLQALAQDGYRTPVRGYITAVQSANDFEVDSWHIVVPPDAGFGLIGAKTTSSNSPLRDAIRVGAYVKVLGSMNHHTHTATASGVYLRDDWDKKLAGLGVIYRVAGNSADPLYLADGYQIRLTPATNITYSGEIKSIADVNVNVWIKYEGKRDSAGVLVASKATFLPAKPTQYRGTFGQRESPEHGLVPASERHVKKPDQSDALPDPTIDPATHNRVDFQETLDKDGNLTADAGIRYGLLNRWHTIPADPALQSRIQRIGARLVPAYQRDLPAGHPSKIHFRFYAVDDDKTRWEICPLEGLILIPTQVVNELHSDDQVAAILANGVAFNLQRQAARVAADNRILLGIDAVTFFVPGLGLAASIGTIDAANNINIALEEERGRIALALLDDAGFDPRQSPDAWRQLASKHGKTRYSDSDSFDFPGYQLSILNLQYREQESADNASPLAAGR